MKPSRCRICDYVATYIQRDVRQVTQVQNLDVFTRFIRLCAGSVGQLFNANRIGADCGIDNKTARQWLSVLQAGYVASTVPAYYENFRKRVIKTPKLYFHDTGVVCCLLGIRNAQQLTTHPLRGSIFENWVFCELNKNLRNQGRAASIYFWRTHGGQEVDFIVEDNGIVLAIEVIEGMTLRPGMLHSLPRVVSQWPAGKARAFAVYGGEEAIAFNGIEGLPWREVSGVFSWINTA